MSLVHHVFAAGDGFQRAGFNTSLQTANAGQMLWSRSDALVIPINAAVAEIVSSSADDQGVDSPLGTGARTVILSGIDSSFNAVFEVVTLNGLTPVVTTQQFCFVDQVIVMTAGGNGDSNLGTLTIRIQDTDISPFPVVATVEPNHGISNGMYFAVPNPSSVPRVTRGSIARKWYMLNTFLSVAQGTGLVDFVRVSVNFHNLTTDVNLRSSDTAIQSGEAISPKAIPTELTPGQVVYFTIDEVSANNLQISGFLDGGQLAANTANKWYRRHT